MARLLLSKTFEVRFYEALLRIRPAQLTDFLKRILGVHRVQLTANTGCTYWADPASIFGLQLLRDGVHEPQMSLLLKIVLRPGDSFIDVGANEGYFSILAASLTQTGPVYSFEPQSSLRSVIEENIRLNSVTTINLYQAALGNRAGNATLYLRPSTGTGSASFFRYWNIGFAREVVPVITLDSFFKDQKVGRIRLLKIDCEGAENQIVPGGYENFRQTVFDFIALEYHPSICGLGNCHAIHQQLKSCGYLLTKTNGQYIYHLPGLESEIRQLGNLQIDCDWDN